MQQYRTTSNSTQVIAPPRFNKNRAAKNSTIGNYADFGMLDMYNKLDTNSSFRCNSCKTSTKNVQATAYVQTFMYKCVSCTKLNFIS